MTDCFIFPKHAYEYTLKTSTECSIDIKKQTNEKLQFEHVTTILLTKTITLMQTKP